MHARTQTQAEKRTYFSSPRCSLPGHSCAQLSLLAVCPWLASGTLSRSRPPLAFDPRLCTACVIEFIGLLCVSASVCELHSIATDCTCVLVCLCGCVFASNQSWLHITNQLTPTHLLHSEQHVHLLHFPLLSFFSHVRFSQITSPYTAYYVLSTFHSPASQ